MNKIIFSGNLGRDAEVRLVPQAAGSLPVCNFSVAVKLGFGERTTTEWRDCALWGERAQKLSRYLCKGQQVVIAGEPSLRSYPKRDGTQGTVMMVRVDDVTLVGGKTGDHEGRPVEATETKTVMNGSAVAPAASTEDVPF